MRLREAVDLWDAVRGSDYAELERTLGGGKALTVDRNFIAEVGDPSTIGPWPDVAADTRVVPHSAALRDTNLDRSPSQAEICHLAWHQVEQEVTVHLRTLTEPCLVYSDSVQRPMLHFVPKTLLGALWLQLAWAIDGRKDFRRCRSCRDWFAVGHDAREFTAARVFCSDGCRVRENRRKKRPREQTIEVIGPLRLLVRGLMSLAHVQFQALSFTVSRWVRDRGSCGRDRQPIDSHANRLRR